jgi:hypothetical protein
VVRYDLMMGRTALYRDPEPWLPPRADVQLDSDTLYLRAEGRTYRHFLHGCTPAVLDGCFVTRDQRRFVRMLVLDDRTVIITPPDRGAVAPHVVPVPEAPSDAWIVETHAWEVLAEWMLCGGRLGACTIDDLARLATIASREFASLIGEVAAQRAIELSWPMRGPLRGGTDLDIALQPFVEAARSSQRAAEALISAFAHAAGARRRHRG